MKKDLPRMYRCIINKKLNNIQDVYSSIYNEENKDNVDVNNKIDVENKINNIFNSCKFVYKADVNIVLENKTIKKSVVAKRNNMLITIDNEAIPIRLIKDIY